MGERHRITTLQELEMIYGAPRPQSLLKEVGQLTPEYRVWIEASPFAVVATSGPGGLDVSPRGDPAPLVRIVDDKTLLLPERRGNNRADGLRNLLDDPRVSMLFLVPGIAETLRVNGTASISVDPDLLASFAVGDALPKCVIEVHVEAVYFQCGRAMLRSAMWNGSVAPSAVPSAGEMLEALTGGEVGGPSYDQELPTRQRSTLY